MKMVNGANIFSIAPLTGMKPSFITLDALGLKNLNKNSPVKITDVIKKAEKLCPNKELGRSFKTDGTQAIVQFIQVVPVSQKGDAKREEDDKKKMRDLECWRLEKEKSRPKLPVLTQTKSIPSKESFMEKDNGLFHQVSAFKSDGNIQKVIGIDPGQKNIWCVSVHNPQDCDPKSEATKILNLTRPEYK